MNKMFGEKNPQWKGEDAGYGSIHDYVRIRKPKPELCERCHERPAIDMANISGEYLRDLSDWEYLCRKCHMDGDGRNDFLRKSGRSRKLPDQKCLVCGKDFHRDKLGKYCSRRCMIVGMTGVRKPKVFKKCMICNKKFLPKNSTIVCCSRHCGVLFSWKNRKNEYFSR